jgi:hypothetical protein
VPPLPSRARRIEQPNGEIRAPIKPKKGFGAARRLKG